MSPVWNKCENDIWSLVIQPSIHVTEWCCPSLCPVQKSRMEAHKKLKFGAAIVHCVCYWDTHLWHWHGHTEFLNTIFTLLYTTSTVQCTFVSRAANPTAQCCLISHRASLGSRISQREGHIYLEVMLTYRSCFSCVLLCRHLYVMNIFVLCHFLFFFIIL